MWLRQIRKLREPASVSAQDVALAGNEKRRRDLRRI
jgi:hypothetical protein